MRFQPCQLQQAYVAAFLAVVILWPFSSAIATQFDCRGKPLAVKPVPAEIPLFENRKFIGIYQPDAPDQDSAVKSLLSFKPDLVGALRKAAIGFDTSQIDPAKSLLITEAKVLENIDLGDLNAQANVPRGNTFAQLMAQFAAAAKNPYDPTAYILDWLGEWRKSKPNVNDWDRSKNQLGARAENPIVSEWGTQGFALDKVPMRLIAIVNRTDLADQKQGNAGYAGELRFVFAFSSTSSPGESQFHSIIEYPIQLRGAKQVRDRAVAWCNLARLDLASEAYLQALTTLVKMDLKRASLERKPYMSVRLRTNDGLLFRAVTPTGTWQLREHKIDTSGRMALSTVSRTPQPSVTQWTTLNNYLTRHGGDLLRPDYEVPLRYGNKKPFRGDVSQIKWLSAWDPMNLKLSRTRHEFAFRTCNGCHHMEAKNINSNATDTQNFAHIFVDSNGNVALSSFLSGQMIVVADPVDQSVGPYKFNELERRKCHLALMIKGIDPKPCRTGPSMLH